MSDGDLAVCRAKKLFTAPSTVPCPCLCPQVIYYKVNVPITLFENIRPNSFGGRARRNETKHSR